MSMEKENLSEGDVLKKTDDAATRIRARIAARAVGAKEEKTEQPAVSSELGEDKENKSEIHVMSKEEVDELLRSVYELEKAEKEKLKDEIVEGAEPAKHTEEVGLENEILEGEAAIPALEQAPEKLVEKLEENDEIFSEKNKMEEEVVEKIMFFNKNCTKVNDKREKLEREHGDLYNNIDDKIKSLVNKVNDIFKYISKNIIVYNDIFYYRIENGITDIDKNLINSKINEAVEILNETNVILDEALSSVSEEADRELEEFENDLKRYKALKEEVLREEEREAAFAVVGAPKIEIADIPEMSAEELFPEIEEEREAAEERISQDVLSGLNSFGISGVELAGDGDLFESFSRLTHGQQLLALQNLEQVRLEMIEEAAQVRYEEETGKMTFAVMVRKWIRGDYEIERDVVKSLKEKLGDIKESGASAVKSGFKKIVMPGIKEKEAKYTKEGLAMFGEDLGLIIKQIQDNNIDVSENPKTGKLEINFFSFDAVKDFIGFDDLSENEQRDFQDMVSDLNQASQELSKMPYEWSVESAKLSEKRAYKKAKKHYEKIKKEFLDLARKNMIEIPEAMRFLNQAEYCIYINKFLNTNPNVEAVIRMIDSPNLWNKVTSMSRVLTSTVAEKGYMAGLGFGARALTAATVGTIGFPVAAFLTGAMTARWRGKEMLFEKTKKARRGKEEGIREKEILLIKNKIKDLNEELKDFQGYGFGKERAEIGDKIERYEEQIKKLEVGEGEERQIIFEKASVLNESLADSIEEIKGADFETDKKAGDAIKSLTRLCEYAEAALAEGLIDFGEITERNKNRYDLMRNLAEAKAFSGYFNEEKQKDIIEERLNEIFGERKEVISETEKRFLRKRMLLGGLMSAAFFEAGYYIRHHFWEEGGGAGKEEPSFKKEAPPTESPSGQKTPKEIGRERRFPRRVEEPLQEEKPSPQTKEREGIVPEKEEQEDINKRLDEVFGERKKEGILEKEGQESHSVAPEDTLKEMEDELKEFEKESSVDKKLYGLSEAEAGVVKNIFSSLNPKTKNDFVRFFNAMPREEKLKIIEENGGGEEGKKALFEHILKYVAEQRNEEDILRLKSAPKILEKERNEFAKTAFVIKKGKNLFKTLENLGLEKKAFNDIYNKYEIKINGKSTGKTAENFGWISENTKVVLDGKNKTINLIPEKGGVVKTNEEYLENLEKRGKKAPEWLNKLRKEVEVEEENKEKLKLKEEVPPPEVETKEAPKTVLPEIASEEPKAPELKSGGLSAPPQAEQLKINEELLPYLETKEGVSISDIAERRQFILSNSELQVNSVKKIFDTQEIINKNLVVNFNSLDIYDKFFGKGVDIEGYMEGNGISFKFDDGTTVSFDKNGFIMYRNNIESFIKSPLSNNFIVDKMNADELSISKITELKNNILARVEAEKEILSVLGKLRTVNWGFDVSLQELEDMLKNKKIDDILTEKWARGFWPETGAMRIIGGIKKWFQESGVILTDEEKSEKVGEILSKYALQLKDSVGKTGLTQKKVK